MLSFFSKRKSQLLNIDTGNEKADKLINDANNKINKMFIFERDNEEISELFNKAGSLYKMNKQWIEAGDAFIQSNNFTNECYQQTSNINDAIICYKKCDLDLAIKNIKQILEIYENNADMNKIAKYQQELAEIYEKKDDVINAIKYYKDASNNYDILDSLSSYNKCLINVAVLLIKNNEFNEAIEIYEMVANKSINNNLCKYNVKEYLFHAGLCALCLDDQITTEKIFKRLNMIDITFESTQQYKLLNELLQTYIEKDKELFIEIINEYDMKIKLKDIEITLLSIIKKNIINGDLIDIL